MAGGTPDERACPAFLFRFRNVRNPKHSAFTLLVPDGRASCPPSA